MFLLELIMESIEFTDENGNKICRKYSGDNDWKDYDSNGNMIYFKNRYGVEGWYEFDSNGNEIRFNNSEGFERWKEYDSDGKLGPWITRC